MDRQSAQKSPILVAQDMVRIRDFGVGVALPCGGFSRWVALGPQGSLGNAMGLGFKI